MFPDCQRPVRCCDGFIVCDNNHGKSIARTAYLKRLTHHRHKLADGGVEVNSQVRDDRASWPRRRGLAIEHGTSTDEQAEQLPSIVGNQTRHRRHRFLGTSSPGPEQCPMSAESSCSSAKRSTRPR